MENFTPRPARPTPSVERKPVQETPVKPVATRSDNMPSRKKEHSSKKPFMWVGIVLAVAVLAVGGWYLLRGVFAGSSIDGSKFQAVFLTSGQVYFGRMQILNDDYIKLTDVFYIQASTASGEGENPQDATASNDMQLIKLGSEVHGPEDAMIINRDQVLFYENLKSDGKVAQAIADYKQQ